MSKFIKGTSIVGALALSFGIWQLAEGNLSGAYANEQPNKSEQVEDAKKGSGDSLFAYESVTIQKGESNGESTHLNRRDNDGKELVHPEVVETIKKKIEGNKRLGALMSSIGEEGIDEDRVHGDHQYDWKMLAKENAEKQKLIDELIETSDYKVLNDIAKEAKGNFAKALEKENLEYYFIAIKDFKYLNEHL